MEQYAGTALGKDYDVEYTNGIRTPLREEGKLISLDENGFVVLDREGRRVLIRKDSIDRMVQRLQR